MRTLKLSKNTITSMLYVFFMTGVLLFGTGCGVFDVDIVETFELSVDMDDLLKKSNINTAQFPGGKVPSQFNAEVPFWFSKQFDLRDNPKVKDYQSKIVNIRVNQISYEVVKNTVNVALPNKGRSFNIFAAPHQATDINAFKRIGFVGSIPAMTSNFGSDLIFAPTGREAIEPLLDALSFSVAASGTLNINGATNPVVPKGTLTLRLKIDVSVSLQLYLSDLPKASRDAQTPTTSTTTSTNNTTTPATSTTFFSM